MADSFELDVQPTVGAQYSTKVIHTETGATTLRIWDTAGQERYRTLAPMYFQGSQAAIVVFSLTDGGTLTEAEKWVRELMEHFDESPKLFLVGNKSDLTDDRAINSDQPMDVANALKAEYFETSAKTGANVIELFSAIADFLQGRASPAEPQNPKPLVEMPAVKSGSCRC
jgi:small GTP-binding protein